MIVIRALAAAPVAAAAFLAAAAPAGRPAGRRRSAARFREPVKTWQVTAVSVSCRTATSLVRNALCKVSGRPHALGTYGGMSCIGGTKGGRAFVQCISDAGRKSVYALPR